MAVGEVVVLQKGETKRMDNCMRDTQRRQSSGHKYSKAMTTRNDKVYVFIIIIIYSGNTSIC